MLGENGAGKSTLIKVLTGVFARDGGTISLDGGTLRPAIRPTRSTRHRYGLTREVNLLPNLSVAENLFIGRQPHRFGLVRLARCAVAPRRCLRITVSISTWPIRSGNYSVAVQQIVAIARAVDLLAKVLILDEPTASLDATKWTLFGILRDLKSRGIEIVFVTHFLDQVYAICDRLPFCATAGWWDEIDFSTAAARACIHDAGT